jgi:hypothetical protein
MDKISAISADQRVRSLAIKQKVPIEYWDKEDYPYNPDKK